MYHCTNCGGNLRFDIPTQMLACDYCGTSYDCYAFDHKEGEDPLSYETNVLFCPQCGGEIICNDLSAADFCSYCGSSVVFESRMEKTSRPAKIIPFQKTKEDCRKVYEELIKKTAFAPRELKNPEHIEKFRGIYIPYWTYGFHYKGDVRLTGKMTYRKGDYDITDYYTIGGKIFSDIDGICYDASSSFDDSISEAIAPFKTEQMKDFSPAYLSGFYADIADVDSEVYQTQANEMANDEAIRIISSDPQVAEYEISKSTNVETMNEKLCASVDEPSASMLPVWFLTWRDRDRVAYTTVNGQTGKIYADIPIDIRKYILVSLVLAIPLYFLLNIIISFTAPVTLVFSGFFAFAAGCLYHTQMRAIVDRDRHVNDRGYNEKRKKAGKEPSEEKPDPEETRAIMKTGRKPKKKSKEEESAGARIFRWLAKGSIIAYLIFLFIRFVSYDSIISTLFRTVPFSFLIIVLILNLLRTVFDACDEDKVPVQEKREIAFSSLAGLAAGVIGVIHPVNDLIYYAGMILVYLGILVTIVMIMRHYNDLITRPIPDFHQRGGRDR